MAYFICKFTHGGRDYYLEWSTIVDAPVTVGMSREQFARYYQDEYGRADMGEFAGRMKRVEEKGTSPHFYESVDDVIRYNRAGGKEQQLTKEEIIQKYCIDLTREQLAYLAQLSH